MSVRVATSIALVMALATVVRTVFAAPADSSKLVFAGKDGKLSYAPTDAAGDIIPDFSNAGYMGGGVRIPEVPVKITLKPGDDPKRDDTERIQQAIDQVAKMPLEKNGTRGAVLLTRGKYRV